ncbi:hypothetical protein EX30DRAFT_134161 [Ascodesmis nigricans]|uniref:Uncharacterized protein n=1 Tax=Ascodesmis nigricans TaxID=341454 RepID=A0A4S2MSF6_9PEZI|nr:hypothetical protein EX30DRAFT_134161 [Ascodesmis nigricans]
MGLSLRFFFVFPGYPSCLVFRVALVPRFMFFFFFHHSFFQDCGCKWSSVQFNRGIFSLLFSSFSFLPFVFSVFFFSAIL